jgi:O-methyltransferase involved in polyketide biosynthesis
MTDNNILCFRRIIKDFLRRCPSGTIVNMGYTLGNLYGEIKNERIKWYELRLPEEQGNKTYTDDGRIFLTSTFLDDDWFDTISHNGNMLFVAERVFAFYDMKSIKALLSRLCNEFPYFEMLFNALSPSGMRAWNYSVRKTFRKEHQVRWGLNRTGKLKKWNPRFRVLGSYRCSCDLRPAIHAGNITTLILRYFFRWTVIHIRLRYNYRKMKCLLFTL